MTKVRLCFHDRCFDGTASAALFYRFYREKFDKSAQFQFTGMTHRAAQPWEDGMFDGDENVIVDFKYSNSPKVTWWFDHHQSAFLTPADAEQFRQQTREHMFYEPDYKSCTKLIATVTREKFGFDTAPLGDLIHWGDIIDGAQYPTPQAAVELVEPATDRKSTRLNSSHSQISYAVFCLKKKKKNIIIIEADTKIIKKLTSLIPAHATQYI